MNSQPNDATVLLKQWRLGDQVALNDLIKILSPELRKSAIGIAEFNRHKYQLQPTELINEALIRMLDIDSIDWQDRAHFLAIAAITMRRVLVDEARRFRAAKRSRIDVTLSEGLFATDVPGKNLAVLDVDDALNALGELFPDRCRIVELKFFAGMTNEEIAEVEGISISTVKRHWRSAKAWILDYLTEN